MANRNGDVLRGVFMAVFSTKILRWEGRGRGKFDFSCSGAAGSGAELVPGRGAACGAWEGGGGAVWCGLSQRVILIRFYWYILRVTSVILYRCTFVPRDGDGRREGMRAAGGQAGGDTPPLDDICWDDKGVWNAEIFFRV